MTFIARGTQDSDATDAMFLQSMMHFTVWYFYYSEGSESLINLFLKPVENSFWTKQEVFKGCYRVISESG